MKKIDQNKEPKLNSLLDVQKMFPDEKTCRDFLIKQRWSGNLVCIKCGSTRKLYRINGGELIKCADCRKQFSPRVGTFFEDSALPLQKWFFAIYLIGAHKKGISSCQLARDIQVTQKTAWFMLQRIRYGISTKAYKKPLSGTIEADETYLGGKEGNKHANKRLKGITGGVGKQIIAGAVERSGIVRTEIVENTRRQDLHAFVKKNIASGSTLYTDEHSGYDGLEEYKRKKVRHSVGEYVRGEVHTQNIENFWSMLKRGILGIYHHVSPKHLHRYCDEFAYRYNSRKTDDTERFKTMLANCEGKLTFMELTA